MDKKNSIKLIISSLVILLPGIAGLFVKDRFVGAMRTGWYFTWILPIVLALINAACIFFTVYDNKKSGQNDKILNLIYWIMPSISIYTCGMFIFLGLGFKFSIGIPVAILIGLSMIIVGNYAPKSVRNRTFGIKCKWTLANDDNWRATHRFFGRVSVICGAVIMLLAFFPEELIIGGIIGVTLFMIISSLIYPYWYYKKQLREGTATPDDFKVSLMDKEDKKKVIYSLVAGGIVVAIVAVMMFVGTLRFSVGDDALEVDTTFGGGITLEYNDIVSIEYCEENVSGTRVSGFASSKLLYGWFKNDQLGNYTRYTYTNSGSAIIIRTSDEILVIADENPELTKALYDTLLEKIN